MPLQGYKTNRPSSSPIRHSSARSFLKSIELANQWDNPTMIVILDDKRRLTVPVGLAPASPGDTFDARFDEDDDAIIFRRIKRGKSWLKVLKACPVPMDDLPTRSREYPRKPKL